MELFNDIHFEIDGITITSKKLAGYAMGKPYLLEPLLKVQYIKDDRILYKVKETVDVFIELKDSIHDFIVLTNEIVYCTKLGLYRCTLEDKEITLIQSGLFIELNQDKAICLDGSAYTLNGDIIREGIKPITTCKQAIVDTDFDLILKDFDSSSLEVKELVRQKLEIERSNKHWINIADLYPPKIQQVELGELKYSGIKSSIQLLNLQNNRIKEKQEKRLAALKEINNLKDMKPRRDHFGTKQKQKTHLGILDHMERYTTGKLLYTHLIDMPTSPTFTLILSMLGMDIDHFHTFAFLNLEYLKDYLSIEQEVKQLIVHLEEAREDLKRIKTEIKRKTTDKQDQLDISKEKYNQIKSVYSDRVKYKEHLLSELNKLYEQFMNDISHWNMSLIGSSSQIFNSDSSTKGNFYILPDKLYKEMSELLQNQKIKHEDTRNQKFQLQRLHNVKQSEKQVIEKNIVSLKSSIKEELFNKFGKELTLKQAEEAITSSESHEQIPKTAINPELSTIESLIQKETDNYKELLIKQTELNADIHQLNQSYMKSSIVHEVERKPLIDFENEILVLKQHHKTLTDSLKETEQDIKLLKLYPSKAGVLYMKWVDE